MVAVAVKETTALRFNRTVRAKPADVFRAFTHYAGLSEWLCDTARVRGRQDGFLLLGWNDGYYVSGSYTTLERDREVSFTWQGCGEPESEVSVVIQEKDGATQITLTHEVTGDYSEQFKELWEAGLENLQSVLETGDDLRFTRRPMLGIFPQELEKEKAAELGVPVTEGLLLTGVLEGMGAEAAGLQKNDVVVGLDGKPARDFASLMTAIKGYYAGDAVEVMYYRGAERKTVNMTLSKRPITEVPETAEALAQKVETLYAELDAELREVFEGVSGAEATQQPEAREWSAKDTVAHLIADEHWIQEAIGSLLAGDELESFSANVFERARALAATYPDVASILAEMKRSQAETVALIRMLPPELVSRRNVFVRAGRLPLDTAIHSRDHFGQMRRAIEAARQ